MIVPGLGALGYLLPTVRACAGWTQVHLLDVPGFGHRRTARCPATVTATARAVAAWLRTACDRPVLLIGHSTGAQVAVCAAMDVPERVHALVMAGPTFPPPARRWLPLARRIARTLPHERLGIIPAVAPEYLRGRLGVLTLLRSAMADAPEQCMPQVTCPVRVMRGEHDAVSPEWWTRQLASRAPHGSWSTLPGGHNFPYMEPMATGVALHALS